MEPKLSSKQQEAKKYVQTHQLEKLVGQMLNTLVHAKDPSPKIFMINYLAGLCSPEELQSAGISVSGQSQTRPLLKFPSFPEQSKSLLRLYLTKDLWNSLSQLKTKHKADLSTLIKRGIEDPNNQIGVFLPDEEAYSVFSDLITPIAQTFHGWNSQQTYKQNFQLVGDWKKIDMNSEFVKSSKLSISRNYCGIPFTLIADSSDREKVTQKSLQALVQIIPGKYYTLDDPTIGELEYCSFSKKIRLQNVSLNSDWPQKRGVYVADEIPLFVNVNGEDHLKIYSVHKGSAYQSCLNDVVNVLQKLESKNAFSFSQKFGFLTTCPSKVGTALTLSFHIAVPNLQSSGNLQKILENPAICYKTLENGCLQIYNKKKIGLTESQIIETVVEITSKIIQAEKELTGKIIQESLQKSQDHQNQSVQPLNEQTTQTSFGHKQEDCLVNINQNKTIIAKDPECFKVFREIYTKAFQQLHENQQYIEDFSIQVPPKPNSFPYISSWRVKISRNIKGHKFIPGMQPEDRKQILDLVLPIISQIPGKTIYLQNQQPPDDYKYTLVSSGIQDFLKFDYFPKYSILHITPGKVTVRVNVKQHIEILSFGTDGELQDIWQEAWEVHEKLSSLGFQRDEKFGYLNSSIRELGTGTSVSARVKLLKVFAGEDHNLKEVNQTEQEISLLKRIGSFRKISDQFIGQVYSLIDREIGLQSETYPFTGEDQKLREIITQEIWEQNRAVLTEQGFNLYQHIKQSIENSGFQALSLSSFTAFKQIISSIVSEKPLETPFVKDLTVPDFPDLPELEYTLKAYRNSSFYPFSPVINQPQKQALLLKISEILQSWTQDLQVLRTDQSEAPEGLFTNINQSQAYYKNQNSSLQVLINDTEHITILSSGNNLQRCSIVLLSAIKAIEARFSVAFSEDFGHLSSDLSHIGTSLLLSARGKLEKSISHQSFEGIIQENFLSVKSSGDGHLIEFQKVLGVSETEALTYFSIGIKKLFEIEAEQNKY